ncbi:MAG: Spy/CpxP family protein refolding chaperone [Acidobacteria bacterium]|nr:Spy/CpxP family protein refolding chaperone [Acidobacteriota bacterium]
MSRWLTLIWCAILIVGLPALAGAQGFKWWQQDRFKTDLVLTPEQCTKLEDVFQGLLPKMTAGKESLDRLEKRLSDVIAEGTAAEPDVMKLVDQVEAARGDLDRTRTLMVYRMHRLLTPEQRLKMKALHDSREQERRKGGRTPGHRPETARPLGEGGVL